MSCLRCVLIGLSFVSAGILAPSAQAQLAPTDNPTSSTWQHLRMDNVALEKIGGGDAVAGLNKLGDAGYQLYIVTSVLKNAGAGFHYFRRPPWNKPTSRPKFEYRRLDPPQIEQAGGGTFDDGLVALEREGWQLVAVTSNSEGGVGFHFFQRPKAEAAKP